ncbi:hypothetical protein FH972_024553 [Carpinus fangiana]|uniref:Uncharacterized protein n=1 Tax=Carpinus fangiana TaxID=176857 RepID=A0A5N6KYB4_9ROSI|nr:hypothetical protein FH972_024553 [Carpinus fangiana]
MARDAAGNDSSSAKEAAEAEPRSHRTQPVDGLSGLEKRQADIEEAQAVWRDHIHTFDFPPESDGILDSLLRGSSLELHDLVSNLDPKKVQPWFSPNYQVSYPALRDFLALCDIRESSKASLTLDSFGWDEQSHKLAYFRSFTRREKYAELWGILKTRATGETIGDASKAARRVKAVADLRRLIPSRAIQITDLSPLLSSIILASVPSFNRNTVASFFDRYLSGASSGKALPQSWSKEITKQHAFVFEYHISFFYVPDVKIHKDLPTRDFRNLKRPNGTQVHLRRGAPFTFNPSEPSRWIYEEQRSFLLIGCGPYIQTSIQLAENYFTGPYVRSYGRRLFPALESQPRPSGMFLDWLQYTMHLVNGRWQQTIDAVNQCIHTSSDIIFSEDHLDLLADDPQFSRSKTYFWALQAYKMFDEKLTLTIETWIEFKESKLRWVDDGHFSRDEWSQSIDQIQKSIDGLCDKRRFIRSKSEEVRHLREGLFGASSLFDSRTAVRQGDNIRLLTWITILFLPLTFCTSVFGMQVVLPVLPIHVFVVTLPCVFLGTAFILFNASNMIDQGERLAQWTANDLRLRMKEHHHERWHARLDALQRDKQNQDGPVRRVPRQSSHWTYVVFGLTLLLFNLPVQEIEWLMAPLLLFQLHKSGRLVHKTHSTASDDPEASPALSLTPSPAPEPVPKAVEPRGRVIEFHEDQSRRTRALRRSRIIRTVYPQGYSLTSEDGRRALLKAFSDFVAVLFIAIRVIFQILWIPMVLVEYIILLPLIALDPFYWFSRGSGDLHGSLFYQPFQWLGFGVAAKIKDTQRVKPSTFKQAVILYQKKQYLWEPSDAADEEKSWRKLRQRRTMPNVTRNEGRNNLAVLPTVASFDRGERPRVVRASSAMGRFVSTGRRPSNGDIRSHMPAPSIQDRGRARLDDDLNVTLPSEGQAATPSRPRRLLSRSRSRGRLPANEHSIQIEVTDAD